METLPSDLFVLSHRENVLHAQSEELQSAVNYWQRLAEVTSSRASDAEAIVLASQAAIASKQELEVNNKELEAALITWQRFAEEAAKEALAAITERKASHEEGAVVRALCGELRQLLITQLDDFNEAECRNTQAHGQVSR